MQKQGRKLGQSRCNWFDPLLLVEGMKYTVPTVPTVGFLGDNVNSENTQQA